MKAKSTLIKYFVIFVLSFVIQSTTAQSWPSQSWASALNITAVMDAAGIDQLSGLHWNPVNNRLYGVQNNGRLRVLQMNTTTNTFTQIGNKSISGGPEGITQANLSANEFYVIDENNYEIQKYTHNASFSTVTQSKHWNLLSAPSPMPNTGNIGPEGIVFIPDSNLTAAGFRSSVTGQTYTSTKGAGGLFFIAHQDGGYVWVFDINPNTNNDFAYVGKYATAHPESCDLAFDRSTGLLYILHNIDDNYLEVTDLTLSTAAEATFHVVHNYVLTATGDANINIEGFALMPKCGTSATGSAWLCRDVSNNEDDAILKSALKWFTPFIADGTCTPLSDSSFEKMAVSVFPNPATNQITIAVEDLNNATLLLYNSLGQAVMQPVKILGNETTIDVSKLPVGIYFFEITKETGTSRVKWIKN